MLLLVDSLQVTLIAKFANLIVFKLKKYIIKIGSASTAQSSRILSSLKPSCPTQNLGPSCSKAY